MKKHWLINVGGHNGYSMVVLCEAQDDEEAIYMADKADLFQDEEDAAYAFAEEADEQTIEHFTKNGLVQEI